MTHREQSLSLLVALLDLARAGLPLETGRLAGRIGLSMADTEAALGRLESVGLVVRGPRLTMTGLALATSLAEDRERRRFAVAA
jgi:hypothetical protein